MIELLGYCTVVYALYHCTCFMWMLFRCYVLPSLGYYKELLAYGQWAVITGATDGIGKEYATQLAGRGFSVVLISRTKSKLDAVAKEIAENHDVNVKVIVYDFHIPDGYERIEKELQGMDIGVLVNNVGMSYGALVPFYQCEIKRNVDIINTNVFSDVMMTYIVMKGMVQRKRGLIIHISSLFVDIISPLTSLYGPSKIFMSKFVKNLQLEHLGVDHQLVEPSFVATNMTKMKPWFFFIPSAEAFVRQSLGTIGLMRITHGYWFHELQAVVLQFLPQFIVNFVLSMRFGKRRE